MHINCINCLILINQFSFNIFFYNIILYILKNGHKYENNCFAENYINKKKFRMFEFFRFFFLLRLNTQYIVCARPISEMKGIERHWENLCYASLKNNHAHSAKNEKFQEGKFCVHDRNSNETLFIGNTSDLIQRRFLLKLRMWIFIPVSLLFSVKCRV